MYALKSPMPHAGAVKKSPTTFYFSKRDPDETICEKITRLNILPN